MSQVHSLGTIKPEQERHFRDFPLGPGMVIGRYQEYLEVAPIKKLSVKARITGAACAVQLQLLFETRDNPCSEAYFLFPIRATIAVVQFQAKVGEHLLSGVVLDSNEAYEKRYGQDSGPVWLAPFFEYHQEPMMMIRLGDLEPRERVEIQMAYSDFLSLWNGHYLFHFPLVIHKSLSTGSPLRTFGTRQTEEGEVLYPGLSHGAEVSIQALIQTDGLNPGEPVSSQTSLMRSGPEGYIVVELAQRQPLANRDYSIVFRLWTEPVPKGWLRTSPKHFMFTVFPPLSSPATKPRDLVILLDGSENMSEKRFHMVKSGMIRLLKSLGPEERFALVAFNREIEGYEHGVFRPSSELNQCLNWLESYQPKARADLKVLLGRVLDLDPEPGRALSVLLIAAGEVGNEPEMYERLLESRSSTRFFTLGIGNDVNASFLRRMSQASRGTSFIMASNERLDSAILQLAEDTKQPLLSDLVLKDKGLEFVGETLTPEKPGVLSLTTPLTLLGVKRGNGSVQLQAKTFSGSPWSDSVGTGTSLNPALHIVWAQKKLLELSDEYHLRPGAATSHLRDMAKRLASEFSLLSDTTAMVLKDSRFENPLIQVNYDTRSWVRKIVMNKKLEGGSQFLDRSSGLSKKTDGMMSKKDSSQRVVAQRSAIRKGLVMREGSMYGGGRKLAGRSKLDPGRKFASEMKSGSDSRPTLSSVRGKPASRKAPQAPKADLQPSLTESSPTTQPSEQVVDAISHLESPPGFSSTGDSLRPPSAKAGSRDDASRDQSAVTSGEGGLPPIPGSSMPVGELPPIPGSSMPVGELPPIPGSSMPVGELPPIPGGDTSMEERPTLEPQNLSVEDEERGSSLPTIRGKNGGTPKGCLDLPSKPSIGQEGRTLEPPSLNLHRGSAEGDEEGGLPTLKSVGGIRAEEPPASPQKVLPVATSVMESSPSLSPSSSPKQDKVVPKSVPQDPLTITRAYLAKNPQLRSDLMAMMREMHGTLRSSQISPDLWQKQLEALLKAVHQHRDQCVPMGQIFQSGLNLRKALLAKEKGIQERLLAWLKRFAQLF